LNAAGVDQHAAPFLRARACERRLTSPFRHWSCNRQDGAGLRGGYERGLRLLGSPLAHLAPPALMRAHSLAFGTCSGASFSRQ
jgi:hypothetical protein